MFVRCCLGCHGSSSQVCHSSLLTTHAFCQAATVQMLSGMFARCCLGCHGSSCIARSRCRRATRVSSNPHIPPVCRPYLCVLPSGDSTAAEWYVRALLPREVLAADASPDPVAKDGK